MTLTFPQLETGTSGQFPLRKTITRRTVLNRLGDGTEIRLADPDGGILEWELEYRGLSEAERSALTGFFGQVRGRLRSFLFLDPCGNLLSRSEDLLHDVWNVDGMIRVEPQDGYTRLINTAQTPQSVSQTVDIPGWYRYSGSCLTKAGERANVRLWLSTADGLISSGHSVSGDWQVAMCSGNIGGAAEALTFGVELSAGLALDVQGLQLEAQPGRSGYRRTSATSGRFPETRFDQDELVFRADGIDNYSTSIRLVSRVRL